MTPEKRETAIKWLTEEIRSLRMAPAINGCGPENWADQLEIMETCLEAVKAVEGAGGRVRTIDANATIEALRANFQQGSWYGCEDPLYQIAEDTISEMPTLCVDGNHDVEVNKMVPLTLEQLRGKVGQPVVIKYSYGGPHTVAIVDVRYVPHLGADKIRLVFPDGYITVNERDYGTYFTTYAYPPAHIDREVLQGSWEGEADGYADGALVYDVWRCGDCGHVEETDDPALLPRFCPSCGRAMTPEAWAELEKRWRG